MELLWFMSGIVIGVMLFFIVLAVMGVFSCAPDVALNDCKTCLYYMRQTLAVLEECPNSRVRLKDETLQKYEGREWMLCTQVDSETMTPGEYDLLIHVGG